MNYTNSSVSHKQNLSKIQADVYNYCIHLSPLSKSSNVTLIIIDKVRCAPNLYLNNSVIVFNGDMDAAILLSGTHMRSVYSIPESSIDAAVSRNVPDSNS